jgi:hypothetical protein
MFEKKKLAKRTAEEEKEGRKQKRIEAKAKKDRLVPAMTTVKWKLFKKTGVDSSCSSCHKIITTESGIHCNDCNKVFHEKVFQNTLRSAFPFLKMVMNSSVTSVTK